jgi:hypothetical protein
MSKPTVLVPSVMQAFVEELSGYVPPSQFEPVLQLPLAPRVQLTHGEPAMAGVEKQSTASKARIAPAPLIA